MDILESGKKFEIPIISNVCDNKIDARRNLKNTFSLGRYTIKTINGSKGENVKAIITSRIVKLI
ncbi:MAG: hypothetical protein P1U56_13555 [Saprospiraceae bacterium]|nr:hypothetical protein [Saprospiraceae bacterium]